MIILLVTGGCARRTWQGFPTAVDSKLVWPGPPESPRVGFVMEIRSQEDLYDAGGFWRSLRDIIAGPADTSMIEPLSIALHPHGGLLVTDPARQRVHFYNWSRRRYVAIGDKLEGGLPSPTGVAALGDGRILVSDSRLGKVLVFDAEGQPQGTFGAPEIFQRPAGIVVDESRREVYIADVHGHSVAVLGLDGGLIRRFGKRGAGPGEFNFPTHLALDPQGRLVVTDSMNFRVQMVERDGKFVSSVGELGDGPGQFAIPKGCGVDARGVLVVAEGRYDVLEFFDAQGQLLLNLGSPGSGPGEFWLASGVLLDRTQNLLFVADRYNSRVQVFRMLNGAAGQTVTR